MTASKVVRKIFSVKVEHLPDNDPDTSGLGYYASKPTSEYSIDRQHALDCIVNSPERPETGCRNCGQAKVEHEPNEQGCPAPDMANAFEQDIFFEPVECDCTGGDMGRNEYRYFNPSFNYVDERGKLVDGNTTEEVRKYVAQDYARMEALNRCDWGFIGIRAVAQVGVSLNGGKDYLLQSIRSGGVWGIESDSDGFEDVEADELADLKAQFAAFGFGRSVIAKAIKAVERP